MTPHIFCRCSSSGNGGAGGTVRNAKNPFSSRGADGMNSRYARRISADRSSDQSIGPATTVSTGVPAERERGDDTEVAAAAAKRPEQIRVLVLARGDDAPVREHDVRREEIAEREPAGAGRADDPRGHGEAECGGRMVDVPEQGAARDPNGGRLRVDVHAP